MYSCLHYSTLLICKIILHIVWRSITRWFSSYPLNFSHFFIAYHVLASFFVFILRPITIYNILLSLFSASFLSPLELSNHPVMVWYGHVLLNLLILLFLFQAILLFIMHACILRQSFTGTYFNVRDFPFRSVRVCSLLFVSETH